MVRDKEQYEHATVATFFYLGYQSHNHGGRSNLGQDSKRELKILCSHIE